MTDLNQQQKTVSRRMYAVKVRTLSPFRVGGVADPLSQADLPIAIVGGRPCIPGSTLKGALRAEIERWLFANAYDARRNRWKDDEWKPCIPVPPTSQEEKRLIEAGRYRDRSCSYGRTDRGRHGDGREGRAKTICPVCYLLGAQGLVGFVNVPFLFAEPGYQNLYSSSIDRASGTVKTGTNRPYQLVPQDTVFAGDLEVILEDDFLGWKLGSPRPLKENPDADAWLKGEPWEPEKLARFVVERIEAIEHLGGYRSKGCGRVGITVEETTQDGRHVS